MKKSIASLFFGIALLSGCYTQFDTLDNPVPRYSAEDTTRSDSTMRASQSYVQSAARRDRQVCYWTRDWFGEPQLRCYTSYFSDDWDYYYNYPWWYSQQSFGGNNCHCPYHIFYHAECHLCWQYCGYCRNCQDNYSGSSYYPGYSRPPELEPGADTMTPIRRSRMGNLPQQPVEILGSGKPRPVTGSSGASAAKPAATESISSPPPSDPAATPVRRSRIPDFAPVPEPETTAPKISAEPAPQIPPQEQALPPAPAPAPAYTPARQDSGPGGAPTPRRRSSRSWQ